MGMRSAVLGLAALGALLLSGCGQGDDGGNDGVASLSTPNSSTSAAATAAGQSDEDKARAFAKCMREHGVDMPDPQVKDGKMTMKVNGGDKKKLDGAQEACKSLLPNDGKPRTPSAADLDRMRAMAKCMREHGVNVPDPTAQDPGIKIQGTPGDKGKVDAAMKACDSNFGKGSHSTNGGGGSDGDKPGASMGTGGGQ
ncbi:hypothetical protein [Labedaea rhizosphaerae]|uniref:PT repeat-containing protein n=1 Tax=Labedaea rhizosphaerae TaxID=598644 RepID=A0A4R6SCW0_LABRH|nr:hypothetical protein [Labedaea rhizosphaerae]TDP97514.1 hypothetical protein EV186_103478 [Labedaea rhizosphaerae]